MTDRPALSFENTATGSEVKIVFGYLGEDHEPTAALFHGKDLVLIPVSILARAISSGWEEDYSILCQALKEEPACDDPECPECYQQGGEA